MGGLWSAGLEEEWRLRLCVRFFWDGEPDAVRLRRRDVEAVLLLVRGEGEEAVRSTMLSPFCAAGRRGVDAM